MGINAYLKQFQLYKILMCPLCASPASPLSGKELKSQTYWISSQLIPFHGIC